MLNKYLIHNTVFWKEVKGQRVIIKGFEDVHLFSHNGINEWQLSEATSGCQLEMTINSKTRKEAIAKFIKYVKDNKRTQNDLKVAIATIIEEHGSSDWRDDK